MAKIERQGEGRTPLVAALFKAVEASKKDWRRPHLGCSVIGRKCWREIWYLWRWAVEPKHDGRLLRLFQHGDSEENRAADDLRQVPGVKLDTIDPETGEQFRVELAPHIGGAMDGKIIGIPEAPKTLHVWDHKTANDKQFAEFKRAGLAKWKPVYYTAAQLYMLGSKIKRAVYTVQCKNDDEMHSERIHYSMADARQAMTKATSIRDSGIPPAKIAESPTSYLCRYCDFKRACHHAGHETLERNCRTCISSYPADDGTWRCTLNDEDKALSVDEQKAGCKWHLFIPELLAPMEPVSVNKVTRQAVYETPGGARFIDEGLSVKADG